MRAPRRACSSVSPPSACWPTVSVCSACPRPSACDRKERNVSVLVVGSVALDSVRTPNGAVEEALGGSASYFSLAARHFTDVQMVAVVGEDFPSKSRELLAASGVDVGG